MPKKGTDEIRFFNNIPASIELLWKCRDLSDTEKPNLDLFLGHNLMISIPLEIFVKISSFTQISKSLAIDWIAIVKLVEHKNIR